MRQQTVLATSIGTIAVVAGFVWAVLPLSTSPISRNVPSATVTPESPTQADDNVDLSVFDVSLWLQTTVPKEEHEVVEETEHTRIQAINLTLLGILNGESTRKAILYDPDKDRLFVAEVGERVGEIELTAVDRDGVTVALGSSTRDLRIGRKR